MPELMTADEARGLVAQSVDEPGLDKAALRDLSRAIQKRAQAGLRDVTIDSPFTGTSRSNQEQSADWVKGARALLTGAGFDVQASRSGSGSFLIVRW